jgi:hypothetical protein
VDIHRLDKGRQNGNRIDGGGDDDDEHAADGSATVDRTSLPPSPTFSDTATAGDDAFAASDAHLTGSAATAVALGLPAALAPFAALLADWRARSAQSECSFFSRSPREFLRV